MKLHLCGIPHTYTHSTFSCCAFTQKCLRFSPMMKSVGYHVIHYGNYGSDSGADEEVMILGAQAYEELGGCEPGSKEQYGHSANVGSPLYTTFNEKLALELEKRVEPGDAICLPFGRAHVQALSGPRCQQAYWVETGIGYRNSFAKFRVFESDAWLNLTAGKENPSGVVMGDDYWFTIPNYYNPDDWPLGSGKRPKMVRTDIPDDGKRRPKIVYMGRLNEDKGMRVIAEIAKRRPDVDFTICGQGDPTPWLAPNVIAVAPFHGSPQDGRASYLGNANATIVPSRYIEPFGGVAAESLLCGTPVLASAFGAFPEYIEGGINGYLCRTLDDWLHGVDCVIEGNHDSRTSIQRAAQLKFSMWNLADDYAVAFKQISDLGRGGWYANVEA